MSPADGEDGDRQRERGGKAYRLACRHRPAFCFRSPAVLSHAPATPVTAKQMRNRLMILSSEIRK
jgi:hypothetical protein